MTWPERWGVNGRVTDSAAIRSRLVPAFNENADLAGLSRVDVMEWDALRHCGERRTDGAARGLPRSRLASRDACRIEDKF
jgi:hypothetical protein